jgi:hypothetical protein
MPPQIGLNTQKRKVRVKKNLTKWLRLLGQMNHPWVERDRAAASCKNIEHEKAM